MTILTSPAGGPIHLGRKPRLYVGPSAGTVTYASTVLADSPSLYWRLGTNGAADQSGNARNGTGAGSVTIGGATGLLVDDADGATDFDGTDDRIEIAGYTPAVNATTRTFECWASRDTNGTADGLMGAVNAWTWEISLAASSNDVSFNPNGIGASTTWADAWPGNGQAAHLVLVFDEGGDSAELFINGATEGAQAVTGAWSGTGLTVGASQTTNRPFDGKIDEVAIYESGLSAARILAHYNAGS